MGKTKSQTVKDEKKNVTPLKKGTKSTRQRKAKQKVPKKDIKKFKKSKTDKGSNGTEKGKQKSGRRLNKKSYGNLNKYIKTIIKKLATDSGVTKIEKSAVVYINDIALYVSRRLCKQAEFLMSISQKKTIDHRAYLTCLRLLYPSMEAKRVYDKFITAFMNYKKYNEKENLIENAQKPVEHNKKLDKTQEKEESEAPSYSGSEETTSEESSSDDSDSSSSDS